MLREWLHGKINLLNDMLVSYWKFWDNSKSKFLWTVSWKIFMILIYIYNIKDGKPLWKIQTDSPIINRLDILSFLDIYYFHLCVLFFFVFILKRMFVDVRKFGNKKCFKAVKLKHFKSLQQKPLCSHDAKYIVWLNHVLISKF